MFCRNCGKELVGTPEICLGCGAKPHAGNSFCAECGGPTTAMAEICVKCGVRLAGATPAAVAAEVSPKSRLVATLLCVFLGVFGAHRFYIGHIGPAVGMLILGILGYGTIWIWGLGLIFLIPVGIWAFVDFILIVTGSMKDKERNVIMNW